MPPILLFLIIGGGLAAAVAAASAGRKYALSEDCQINRLAGMTPVEVQDWLKDYLVVALQTAFSGEGVVAFRSIHGALPEAVYGEVEETVVYLQDRGFTEREARKLAYIDGDTAYLPAMPADAEEVAYYCYQQIAHPNCTVITFGTWGDESSIVWPSPAAKCIYLALLIGAKLELLAKTLDEGYAVTPADLERAAAVCPQYVEEGRSELHARPGAQLGVSVGNRGSGLDFSRMAADANRGVLHPSHVLTGAIFR